jgi:heme-degrading monooxygenase HmoA
MTWLRNAAAFAAGALLLTLPAAATAQPIHQLRVYEIFEHNKAQFHARFRDHAVRIMARHGFTILALWESKAAGRTEFVYLLEWPDEATMKAGWESFLTDPEWIEIKARTRGQGALVGEIREKTLVPTDYSPKLD